ncbi:MAG: M48 family metalloprotease [Xanthomonadaceae bacterium]|nr:M48 family metalloprotease [Xanthomonadaceae bacterium]
MNFFEQQDRARKQTRLLVIAFMLAVVAIVVAMNLIALVVFGDGSSPQAWLSPSFWLANGPTLLATTVVTSGIIGLASLYRSLQLRGGGSTVARELGGVEVNGTTSDPLRRRLLNVVEEMAIASGVPVPEVFVLEHEDGINAFAAGWSPADAAVAVTRGTLETLSRDELQGVIAHEFSHVFNGDMRLNIRLMGVLFGILIMAVVGRKRWIQAALSRQREYLADASAVQFTRSPDGIAGALKKIGALAQGSRLTANTDEVGHMLFASGLSSRLFATHPPLEQRIGRIDPSFKPAQFEQVAQQLERHSQARLAEQEQAEAEREKPEQPSPGGLSLDPGAWAEAAGHSIGESIGPPGPARMLLVANLLAELPRPLQRAAHSDEWAPELLVYLLLGSDPESRENQLLIVVRMRGSESEAKVRDLVNIEPKLPARLRLPLLELAFPAMRRRPEAELVRFMELVGKLIAADNRTEVFEYALARLLNREIEDALNPPRKVPGGTAGLADRRPEISDLVAIVALHGHPNRPDAARAASAEAFSGLTGFELVEPARFSDNWAGRLDEIFQRLQSLDMPSRNKLVEILLRCVRHDGQVVSSEYELTRLVAGVLHIPLPILV